MANHQERIDFTHEYLVSVDSCCNSGNRNLRARLEKFFLVRAVAEPDTPALESDDLG